MLTYTWKLLRRHNNHTGYCLRPHIRKVILARFVTKRKTLISKEYRQLFIYTTPKAITYSVDTAWELISTVAQFFLANALKIYARKWRRINIWKATRKLESWARFNFYVYARPSIHCLYFIYARKIHVRTHAKTTWQWESTLSQPLAI